MSATDGQADRLPDHSFVVPAYGDSPYLRECLASLKAQSLPGSEIIIVSSTPSRFQRELALEFQVEYIAHSPNRGIGADWNAAVAQATRSWVTIAHQDDVYRSEFVRCTLDAGLSSDALLVVTKYREMMDGKVRNPSLMLRIKDVLLELGFLGRRRVRSRSAKMRILRFGCPIPCPAVTLGPRGKNIRFREDLRLGVDWEAWIRLSRQDGSFQYVRRPLMLHRIHSGSETSAGIRGGQRAKEDGEIFRMMWPKPIAALLARVYALSYEAP